MRSGACRGNLTRDPRLANPPKCLGVVVDRFRRSDFNSLRTLAKLDYTGGIGHWHLASTAISRRLANTGPLGKSEPVGHVSGRVVSGIWAVYWFRADGGAAGHGLHP